MTTIVLDIEGTTSSTESVHVGLYAYARPRLGPHLDAHRDDPEVRAVLAEIGAGTLAEAVEVLHGWMDGDVKATPLKTLQGRIWAAGFAAGELTAHFFPDVPPALRAWHAAGHRLAVFSSGAVASQRPWFRHAADGDLSVLVTHWFDTVNAGPKRQPDSYERISGTLGEPSGTLFLSDVPAELDAAAAAGWRTTGVRRPGEPNAAVPFGTHPVVTTFEEVNP
ncbi:acireductone synthase [Nonomuraea glycinis]|uniref:Enolase-phosphatase E1 n=1 Tax=Nonomuraea glycinis TaxID=2047744 RepID=A0A918A7E3_9ACTN|nr:acireductone synthase [Nonomuraea glycinis]MCA2176234.1 acireductone synthase [Nonomuraea glycinis]GGP07580.1 enolase-phosphatase E1 [Nonomuraea glycinis]